MILCVGSTGVLGRAVVEELVGRGEAVRCLVRDGSDAAALEKLGAEIVRGDVRDKASVAKAVAGTDAIISSFATDIARNHDIKTIWDADYGGNLSLIRQARKSGVKKFIFVSYWGLAKFAEFEHGRVKKLVEDLLKTSGIDYTILRLTTLASDMSMLTGESLRKKGRAPMLMKRQEKIRPILNADMAWCVADAIHNPRASNQVIEVAGAEQYTFLELEALFGEAIGRKVRFVFIPPGVAHTVAGLFDRATRNRYNARGIVSAFTGGSACDITRMESVFDLHQGSFAAYLKDYFSS